MSAAEKLKALLLEGNYETLEEVMFKAKREIVSVVEAAADSVDYDPSYANVDDPNPVASALASLDKALS